MKFKYHINISYKVAKRQLEELLKINSILFNKQIKRYDKIGLKLWNWHEKSRISPKIGSNDF